MVLQQDLEAVARELDSIKLVNHSHTRVSERIVGLIEQAYDRLDKLERRRLAATEGTRMGRVETRARLIAELDVFLDDGWLRLNAGIMKHVTAGDLTLDAALDTIDFAGEQQISARREGIRQLDAFLDRIAD
jgi:hypothetical protein